MKIIAGTDELRSQRSPDKIERESEASACQAAGDSRHAEVEVRQPQEESVVPTAHRQLLVICEVRALGVRTSCRKVMS